MILWRWEHITTDNSQAAQYLAGKILEAASLLGEYSMLGKAGVFTLYANLSQAGHPSPSSTYPKQIQRHSTNLSSDATMVDINPER
jgi:hypothetical protein